MLAYVSYLPSEGGVSLENILYVLLALLAAAVLYAVYIYNSLVRKKAHADNGWSQIDVQLKRRYDLIPNLVETVKAYATHERNFRGDRRPAERFPSPRPRW